MPSSQFWPGTDIWQCSWGHPDVRAPFELLKRKCARCHRQFFQCTCCQWGSPYREDQICRLCSLSLEEAEMAEAEARS